MKMRSRKTAAEALAEFENDPAFLERRRRQQEERRRGEEADAQAEAPLVQELREVGVLIASVWDLVNAGNQFSQSLPILLKHLQMPYPVPVLDGIARAIAVPEAKFAWPVLVRLFRESTARQIKDALAVAISNIADDDVLDELVELASDPEHGESRILLLDALGRLSRSDTRNVLMALGADPELRKEVQRILRRL